MPHTSFFPLLARAFNIPVNAPSVCRLPRPVPALHSAFSTTQPLLKKKRGGSATVDKRIKLIHYFLFHPTKHQPRPLRFSRLRALRHWTIHRAWSLYSAQKRRAHLHELGRQYGAIRAACEELRTGAGDGGHLFRAAMEKRGLWGGRSDLPIPEGKEPGDFGRVEKGKEAGVPLEYARSVTETPPRSGFDEGWKRG